MCFAKIKTTTRCGLLEVEHDLRFWQTKREQDHDRSRESQSAAHSTDIQIKVPRKIRSTKNVWLGGDAHNIWVIEKILELRMTNIPVSCFDEITSNGKRKRNRNPLTGGIPLNLPDLVEHLFDWLMSFHIECDGSDPHRNPEEASFHPFLEAHMIRISSDQDHQENHLSLQFAWIDWTIFVVHDGHLVCVWCCRSLLLRVCIYAFFFRKRCTKSALFRKRDTDENNQLNWKKTILWFWLEWFIFILLRMNALFFKVLAEEKNSHFVPYASGEKMFLFDEKIFLSGRSDLQTKMRIFFSRSDLFQKCKTWVASSLSLEGMKKKWVSPDDHWNMKSNWNEIFF